MYDSIYYKVIFLSYIKMGLNREIFLGEDIVVTNHDSIQHLFKVMIMWNLV